jgi:hypothetical protein
MRKYQWRIYVHVKRKPARDMMIKSKKEVIVEEPTVGYPSRHD